VGGKGKKRLEERVRKCGRKGQGKVEGKGKDRLEERARKGWRKGHEKVEGKGKFGGKGKER